MMLVWLVAIPLLAGPVAWLAERRGPQWPRWVACGALGLDLLMATGRWAGVLESGTPHTGRWLAEWTAAWIPRWGISAHLAMDGVSLLLVILSGFLGIMAVVASWTEIRERVGFFHFNLLWVIAGTIAVFLSMDLFLFFVFWEVMLVPMYLLINIWGHEHKTYAAFKFFLFTQAGSLFLLVAIIGLVFVHVQQTRVLTFDYPDLLDTPMAPRTALWLLLGFFAAFAVKLPAFPVHSWLPDAHTEAPTGGSVLLAGLLLKTGAYGLLRFAIPLFPEASVAFAPVAMALGVIGILYGAILAFTQTDLKRLVAYSSISHLGFVLLGLFAWNTLALQGAVMQMLAHGVSTGALFMLVGALQERLHTRDMREMGGLWATVPRLAAIALFFALASLGLPGLGNFVGEFLVLLGSYQVTVVGTAVAALGLVAATIYALALVQRTFYGPLAAPRAIPDLSSAAIAAFAVMIAVQVWLGLYPQPVLSTVQPALDRLQASIASTIIVQR